MSHNNNAHVQSALIRDECAYYREHDNTRSADREVCNSVVQQNTYARDSESMVQKGRDQYPNAYDQHRADQYGRK